MDLKQFLKHLTLEWLIRNQSYILCPFMTASQFASHCKDCGIDVDEAFLERLEELGAFYPLLRIQSSQANPHFSFSGNIPHEWLTNGQLWSPREKSFVPWKSYLPSTMESFYSKFQCLTLRRLICLLHIKVGLAGQLDASEGELLVRMKKMQDIGRSTFAHIKTNPQDDIFVELLCQAISNRYYPETQTDHRTTSVTVPFEYFEWDWNKYRRKWNPVKVVKDLSLNEPCLRESYTRTTMDKDFVNPVERWSDLLSFIPSDERREIKGDFRLYELFKSMSVMLSRLYEDTYGKPPSIGKPEYNERRAQSGAKTDTEYLEYLVNRYHLNPRPRVLLVVEGEGEADQLPRLIEAFGILPSAIGIEVLNLHGIGNFTGKKKIDRFGALERLIDDYHLHGTIVFILLDNEGGADKIIGKLQRTKSKLFPGRTITRKRYCKLWMKNIEYDNFTNDEISSALSHEANGKYLFTPLDIASLSRQFGRPNMALSDFFYQKVGQPLSKRHLLAMLFQETVLAQPLKRWLPIRRERPVVSTIRNIINLAVMNHPPTSRGRWEEAQRSGVFGRRTTRKRR